MRKLRRHPQLSLPEAQKRKRSGVRIQDAAIQTNSIKGSRSVKKPGDINPNAQEILRLTKDQGSDFNSHIWVLKCRDCGLIYGANGTDAWQRKCPNCQSGAGGLPIPIERDGEKWDRDEHIVAFNLYNRIPFGSIHMRNPQIVELAAVLARKVGSVSYKLANFARLEVAPLIWTAF